MTTIEIPDIRSTSPEDYDHEHRLGQLKRSWPKGIQQQTDGNEGIFIRDGLSWDSIEQRTKQITDFCLERWRLY